MLPETVFFGNWITGGLLAINLTKPLWERVFKRVDKGSDRIDCIEIEVEKININTSTEDDTKTSLAKLKKL